MTFTQSTMMLKTGLIAIAVSVLSIGCNASTPPESASPSPTEQATSSPDATEASPSPADATALTENPEPEEVAAGESSITVETCEVTMARVNDPESPLNVRSSPDTSQDNVVGTLDDGTFVDVAQESDGWLEITNPVAGWISSSRADYSCNEELATLTLVPGTGPLLIEDQIVGVGRHQYVLNAKQGQTLFISVVDGEESFPFVTTPDGSPLVGEEYSSDSQAWSGELPADGEYTFELVSQRIGYEYSFSLELE